MSGMRKSTNSFRRQELDEKYSSELAEEFHPTKNGEMTLTILLLELTGKSGGNVPDVPSNGMPQEVVE